MSPSASGFSVILIASYFSILATILTASYGHYGQHAARIRLNHKCRIWLPQFPHTVSVWFHSSKESLDHIVQNWPGSNLDGQVRFWPNMSGLEASWCVIIIGPSSGRMQSACCQFPRFICVLPQMAWIMILCKISLDLICFWLTRWLCQVLAMRMKPCRYKLICKNHWARFWLMLLSWSGFGANTIQHAYYTRLVTRNVSVTRMLNEWMASVMCHVMLTVLLLTHITHYNNLHL